MNCVTSDSAKLLTEKLSLTRELTTLKPELEHLRSQATYQQTVLAEKLALERQVSTLEVELEAEKRASKRAAKKSSSQERETELQNQVEELQKDLAREKKENIKARRETDAELQSQIEELQKELAREKRDKKKARDGAETNLQGELEELRKELSRERREGQKARSELEADLRNQLEEVQQDLAREKRETAKARKNTDADLQDQLESLQQDLSREKKESEKMRKEIGKARKNADCELQDRLENLEKDLAREKKDGEKARKEADKERKAMETQQALLESKLDQIRTKLRSTKEELKECQTEISEAKAAAIKPKGLNPQGGIPVKNPRKRGASEIVADCTIGTPDGGAVRGKRQITKKGRTEQTMVGEKSMFSITPFLNRTMSIAPDTPGDEEASDADIPQMPAQIVKNTAQEIGLTLDVSTESPVPTLKSRGRKKAADKSKPSERPVLAEAKSNPKTKKAAPKATRVMSTLEKVTEEEDENEQLNDAVPPMKVFTGNDFSKPNQPSKVAKPIAGDDGAKKKKRKLGEGKTLFDEDDGEATKRPGKVNLGAPRLLSKGGLAGPKGGLRGGLASASGFGGFSPLKKDRRGIGASFLG
jgi:hypothetical protein